MFDIGNQFKIRHFIPKIKQKYNDSYYLDLVYKNLINEITSCEDPLSLMQKSEHYFQEIRYLEEIRHSIISGDTNGFTQDEEAIRKRVVVMNKIIQINNLLEDIRSTIEINIRDVNNTLIEFAFDKRDNLICVVIDFKNIQFNYDKEPIYAFILFGSKFTEKNYGYMVLKYYYGKPVLELSSLKVGNDRRLYRGSIALKSIESTVVVKLNNKIIDYNAKNFSKEEDYLPIVNCIFGESGRLSLSYDVDKKSRRKFYVTNGYSFNNSSSFYKFID